MQAIRYFDEFRWTDTGEGLIFEFLDVSTGECVAQAALHDPDAKLWTFRVNVPERYRANGDNPCGLVHGPVAAKRVCELILRNTILTAS